MDYSELKEGQKIVFRHKIGGAGDISQTEKVGYIEGLDSSDRDFPVKVRLDKDETPEGNRVITYLEPEEINNIVD